MPIPLTLQNIFQARQRIAAIARKTPLLRSEALLAHTGATVYLKLETLQETGSFKVRGAANKILSLGTAARQQGVVTVSTGNHGRAVAYVARQVGLPATVCLSERVPANKVEALRRLQAEVIRHGQSQDEAEIQARQLEQERGLTLIPPFDDPDIITGQGTLGLELLEDLPDLETVLVPLSGGGLIAGIALALKTTNPKIRVVGLSMERAAVMYHSLQAGQPVQLPEEPTVADSLQGGIGLANDHTFGLVQHYVDEVILLSEAEIAAGMAFAFFEHHLVLEGAGAVGIAALLANKVPHLGRKVAIILSGGNVDLQAFLGVVQAPKLNPLT
jgi:threonine dehydratase